jgi:enoyl-CoA hydratase
MKLEDHRFQTLRIERRGFVLEVTIDNPKSDLNAVDGTLHEELTALFRELRSESEARAVLLTGSKRAFCAGGDFAWFPELQGLEKLDTVRRDGKQLIWDLLDVEVPIVAALNGPAVGLGASIALLCDVIFMADTASIADPHVRVGIVAGDGGTAIWPLVLGPARAKEFLLTGDKVDAATAERIGLVNRVVPDAELEREALALARRLAAGPPVALRYMKDGLNRALTDPLEACLDLEADRMVQSAGTEDYVEAVRAFQEKRAPVFKGS